MKLTKLLLLSATALGTLTLTSCGGTKEEKAALEKVMKGTIISENSTGSPVVSGTPTDLDGYKNTCVDLTTVQIRSKKTINIEWKVLAGEDKVKSKGALDDNHDRMKFIYGSHAEGSDAFDTTEVKLQATGKCGGAKLVKEFVVNLKHNKDIYDDMSLEQFYAVAGGHYAFQDDEFNIKGNHGQKYYYVHVQGKLEYLSPDGNWGLLSNGDRVIELYQLSKSTDYEVAAEGKYLDVWGSISQYKGNPQVQYCNFMEEMSDHSAIAPMTEYGEMSSDISWLSGQMNRVGTLSNATVKSIVDANGAEMQFSSFNAQVRQVITVTKDEVDYQVAYDYHVAKGVDELESQFNSFFRGLAVGNSVSFKGTLRYSNDALTSGGEFTITPYLPSHLVKN